MVQVRIKTDFCAIFPAIEKNFICRGRHRNESAEIAVAVEYATQV
jgi:hypothetical protein